MASSHASGCCFMVAWLPPKTAAAAAAKLANSQLPADPRSHWVVFSRITSAEQPAATPEGRRRSPRRPASRRSHISSTEFDAQDGPAPSTSRGSWRNQSVSSLLSAGCSTPTTATQRHRSPRRAAWPRPLTALSTPLATSLELPAYRQSSVERLLAPASCPWRMKPEGPS